MPKGLIKSNKDGIEYGLIKLTKYSMKIIHSILSISSIDKTNINFVLISMTYTNYTQKCIKIVHPKVYTLIIANKILSSLKLGWLN